MDNDSHKFGSICGSSLSHAICCVSNFTSGRLLDGSGVASNIFVICYFPLEWTIMFNYCINFHCIVSVDNVIFLHGNFYSCKATSATDSRSTSGDATL